MLPTLAAAVALAVQPAAPDPREAAALERGRALTALLAKGDAAALEAAMSPPFKQAIGGEGAMALSIAALSARMGREQALLSERVFHEPGWTSYYRIGRYDRAPSVTVAWIWGADGKLVGASVTPTTAPAPTDKLAYVTLAPLRLPFDRPAGGGGWAVVWGGRDTVSNYHAVAPDQRFAADILVAKDGTLFRGEGKENADHFCWGEPLLAPAAGRVVAAVGGHPDNPRPGETAPNVPPPGNHVVIDHGGGEHSVIAHLRAGSLAVKAGDEVRAGQRVGACGNSGRSSAPHLHYHLQTGAAHGQGVGLPAQFNGYQANGKPVARGELARGELVNPR